MLFLILIAVWWKPKSPGVVASCFLLFYGTTRIITEVYRQPDDGIALLITLSRGQLLSVLMVFFGAFMLLILLKQNQAKLGGFQKVFK